MRRILIIIVIVLLIGAGVWYFYVRPRQQAGVSPVPNVLKVFFPKTTTNNTGAFGTDTDPNGAGNNAPAAVSPFKQLTTRPVAGFTIFSLTNTVSVPSTASSTTGQASKPTVQTVTDHYLRYVSRVNGYVYEIKNDSVPLQISNVFIPNIYEAFFADGNTTAILRFLRQDNHTIATYSVPIPALNPDGTRTQKSGTYLPDNISALAISPDQKQILRITTDQNGAVITSSNSTGGGIKTLLRSPFEQWLPQWTSSNVFLQTKAASVANGFLYNIDQTTARLRRVVGNVAGLTTSVSPKGTYVLYSQSTANGFTTSSFNTKTNVTNSISLSILPEKCTWLQNEDLICAGNNTVAAGTYPDAWYAGTTHFSDQLYHIATASNTYSVLFDGQNQNFDMTNLQADESQGLLYFIDKNTGLLWQYKY